MLSCFLSFTLTRSLFSRTPVVSRPTRLVCFTAGLWTVTDNLFSTICSTYPFCPPSRAARPCAIVHSASLATSGTRCVPVGCECGRGEEEAWETHTAPEQHWKIKKERAIDDAITPPSIQLRRTMSIKGEEGEGGWIDVLGRSGARGFSLSHTAEFVPRECHPRHRPPRTRSCTRCATPAPGPAQPARPSPRPAG